MAEEILFNDKLNQYTLEKEIKKSTSYKKIPIKFKLEDSTSRFRKEILKKEILGGEINGSE